MNLNAVWNIPNRIGAYRIELNEIRKYDLHIIWWGTSPFTFIYRFIAWEDLDETKMIDSIYVINSTGSKPHNIADKFAIFCRLSSMLAEKENLFFTLDMNFLLTKTAVENGLADLITDYDREKDFFIAVESCRIKIDENHFNMMIREIVENAIKYSKPDDVIVIHGSKEKKVYRLIINGIGRGMSNQEIQKAVSFKDFNEKTNSRNGLGFYIVKLILKLFNGEIKIRSKENKYTRVEITLPLAVSASDSNDFEKKDN